MGGIPIIKDLSRKLVLFASLTLAFTISISDTFAANIEVLTKLEKWLFFATFADEPEEKRIARLEDKVFGETGEGSLDERLNKLDQVLSQRQKDKEDASASSSSAAGAASTTSSAGSSGTGVDSSGSGSYTADFAGNTQSASNGVPPKPLSEDQIPEFPAGGADKAGKNSKNSKGASKGSNKIAQTPLPKANMPSVSPPGQSYPSQGGGSPSGSSYGGNSYPNNSQQSTMPSRPVQPTGGAGGAQSQGNYEAERQRIAVQAAREQEMQDLLQEGARLWRNRHGVEAVERFEQVLRLDPQNAEAHFSIGVIQESLGKYTEALAHYQSARKTNPSNNDYDDAVDAVLKKLQSQRPGTAAPANKGLVDQATAAFKRAEYFSALDLFKQADAKTPNQPLVKYNIGSCYLMLKDHFNALENFKLAKELEPTNERFNRAYNELSAEMRKNEAATQAVQQEYGGGPAVSAAGGGGAKNSGMTPKNQNQGSMNYPGQMPNQRTSMPQQSMPQSAYGGSSQAYPQSSPYGGQAGSQQGSGFGGYPQQGGGNPYQQNSYGNPAGNVNSYQGGQFQQTNPYQGQPQYQQAPQYPQMGMNQQQMGMQGNPMQGGQMGMQGNPIGMQSNPYGAPMQNQQQFMQQPPVSSQDLTTTYGLKVKGGNEGCEIVGIRSGSRAARAGLQLGDVIRTADGNEVMQASQLNQVFQQLNSSQSFPMLIFRKGNIQPIQF